MTESEPLSRNGERSFPTTSFPVWRATQFLSAALRLLDKLISTQPLLSAPPMRRVLNDLALSGLLKSQIPVDYYSAMHGPAL